MLLAPRLFTMSLRMTVVMLFASILVASIESSANELSRSRDELSQLQSSIKKLNQKLAGTRKKEKSISHELDEIEQEMASISKTIGRGEKQLDTLQAEQQELIEQQRSLGRQKVRSTRYLSQLVNSSFRLGREGGLKLLLNQQNPVETGRQLAMYRYVMSAQDEQLVDIRQTQRALQQVERVLQSKAVAIDKQNSSLTIDRNRLNESATDRADALKKLKWDISNSEQKVALYARKEEDLKQLLVTLTRKQESQRKRAEEAARQASKPKPKPVQPQVQTEPLVANQTSVQKNPVVAEPVTLGGFKKNRGRLSLPLKAKIIARFGQRRPESGLRWEGLMFRAKNGQQVAAIYPGQVVYADWFHGYGQLLVLDHGQGFMSLYGHNDLLRADIGDVVQAGQIVADSGTSGGLTDPGLYFEIRQNGEPDDPLKWCRI